MSVPPQTDPVADAGTGRALAGDLKRRRVEAAAAHDARVLSQGAARHRGGHDIRVCSVWP